MSFLQLIKAEMKFVYADVFRRKSVLVMLILWPYLVTAFVLIIGSSMGSSQVFIQRAGVDPVPFFVVSGFVLISTFSVLDDIMWKPLFDEMTGALPYILSSPVNRILYYASLPVPRLVLVVLVGATSVFPVLILYWGLRGLILALAIVGLGILSALVFTPPAVAIAMSLYKVGGESWRLINVVRPLLMLLIGAFYPRWLMPLAGYVLSSLLPPSYCIEIMQRLLGSAMNVEYALMLIGIAIALATVYMPLSSYSIVSWERKKLSEGVKV